MLFVNYKINASREEVLEALRDSDRVVEAEKLTLKGGKPRVHVDLKDERMKLYCELIDAPTRDRDFRHGTAFRGKITEREGVTKISGVILTAPIYHAIMLVLFAYFIYQCFALGGISVVPICLVIFDIFMFFGEFRKQGVLKKYIFRALKITYKKKHK